MEVTIFSDRIVTSSKAKISADIGPKINSSRISNLEILLLDQFSYLILRTWKSAQIMILAPRLFRKRWLSSKAKISLDIGPKINSSRISNLGVILLDQVLSSPGRCPNHDSCASIFLKSQGESNCFNGFHCTDTNLCS